MRLAAESPRWSRWAAAGCIALTLATLPLLANLRVDNSLEIWLDAEGEVFADYRSFVETFGSEEYLLLIYALPTAAAPDLLERLTDLRFSLEEIDGVGHVLDIASIYSRIGAFEGVEAFWENLRLSPLYRNFIVSADGSRAATWVFLEDGRQSRRVALVEAVERAAVEVMGDDAVHLAGSPVVNAALDQATREASRTFFPLVFVLSTIVLWTLFRHPMGVLVPVLSVGSGIVWTLAAVAATGHRLNLVTVALPPLIWVLGLSTSIHLLVRARQLTESGVPPDEAPAMALRGIARPCAYSALTTAVGFCALLASPVQPIREMGLFSAAGVIFCLATNFLLFPTLARPWLRRLPAVNSGGGEGPRWIALVERLTAGLARRPRVVLAICTLVALASLVGIPRLRTDSNVIGFFKADSPIAISHRRALRDFTGHQSIEVVVRPPFNPVTPSFFAAVDRLTRRIEGVEGVTRVVSAVDLVKSAYRRMLGAPAEVYELPSDPVDFSDAWEQAGRAFPHELQALSSPTDGALRLTVLVTPLGSQANRQTSEDVLRELTAWADPSWEVTSTGLVQLLLEMQRRLLQSQIRSFGLALVLIAPILALLLRSARSALLCLLANLLPVLITLGFMGMTGIPLDPATVMIAGIALGIAVDDGIHFLVRLRHDRTRTASFLEAIHESLRAVGPPIVTTTVVASLGFLVLCFSSFRPLFYFGLLTSLTMAGALVANLTILPGLLLLFEGVGKRDTAP